MPQGPTSAPPVPQPLDASRYLKNPCGVLDNSQLGQFGVTEAGRPDTSSGTANTSGPGCIWSNKSDYSAIGFGIVTGNENGLSDLYRANATKPQGFFGYFIPTSVDGYPAVFNDGSDGRSSGDCNLATAVTDKLMIITNQQNGDGPRSCDVAKQVASAVITTLKGGA